jgi:uncharacterized protein Yka (UPF0111/DUF47 family)
MTTFAPPPSPEAAIAELEEIERLADQNSDEMVATFQPEPEMISIGELLLLSVETRIGRIADALETANKIKATHRDDIAGLTANINRLADAFEAMAGVMACVTESVQSDADGVTRCYVRTRDDNHGFFLGQRDERD